MEKPELPYFAFVVAHNPGIDIPRSLFLDTIIPATTNTRLVQDIRSNFTLLERAVAQFDTRFTLRALRSISSLRKRLDGRVLCSVIVLSYSPSNHTARMLVEAIGLEGEAIQAVVAQYKAEIQENKGNPEPLPEVDVYIAILIMVGTHASRLPVCR